MNPFRHSGPIIKDDPQSGASFVERAVVYQDVLKHIQLGDYVQIVGPHQSGRTTLAIDLIGKLLPTSVAIASSIPVLLSCESLIDACREGFINTAVARLRRVMDEYLGDDKYSKLHSMLAGPVPTTLLDFHDFLVTFGDELRQSGEFSEIVIFLDEIEALPDNLVIDVLRLFRALFHRYAERRWESPYRVIILTTHDLSYWHLGKSSPYNVSEVIPLKPFSRQELDILLDENHTGKVLKNLTFDASSRDRIYRETGGHPYLTQRLCHILVERRLTETGPLVLTDRDVTAGVLELFEKGDKNLQGLYSEAPAESEEWRLCRRLAAGQRELFEADNPAIHKMAELGVVSDVNHCCQISTKLYERQILKRCFREEFTQITESLAETERLLLHVSCLQEILLNNQIRQLVLSKMESLTLGEPDILNEDDSIVELSGCLKTWLSDKHMHPDMDEIRAYIRYYNIEVAPGLPEIVKLLSKAFITRFTSEYSGA